MSDYSPQLPSTKVLVCGDSIGSFEDQIQRISKINASKAGPFGVAFLIGRLLNSELNTDSLQPYLKGEKKGMLCCFSFLVLMDLLPRHSSDSDLHLARK